MNIATGPPSSNITEICCLPPPSLPPPSFLLQSPARGFSAASRGAASMERNQRAATERSAFHSSFFSFSLVFYQFLSAAGQRCWNNFLKRSMKMFYLLTSTADSEQESEASYASPPRRDTSGSGNSNRANSRRRWGKPFSFMGFFYSLSTHNLKRI